MAGLQIALLCLLVFLPQRHAQITCYTIPSVAGEYNCEFFTHNFQAATIEECCVETNGYFFVEGGEESCQACIVFGFFNGSEITLPEQGKPAILDVGFIKGGNVQPLTGIDRRNIARFGITVAGNAIEGPNADFTIHPRLFEIEGPDARAPFSLTTFLRIDGVALEPAEDFILTVDGRNEAGRAIIDAPLPGQFVYPTICVNIDDAENATLQFTESDFCNSESTGVIVPTVQLLTEIATNLTVRIVSVNLSEAIERGFLLACPTISAFDPRVPNIATSVADYSAEPREITFIAGGATIITLHPGISIVNDNIYEVEQVFALFLEVVTAIDPVRVDLQSGRFDSVARIFDDDSINIGFEQEKYTVFEAFNATGKLISIPIIKENGQKSELTFEVIATLILGSGPTAAKPGEDFDADPPIQRQDFDPDEQVLNYQLELFDDTPESHAIPEPTETFYIHLSLADEGLTNINIGASGGSLFATATIVIIDDDDVIIGWEQNITRVNESQSLLELCVHVLNFADTVELPEGFEVSLAANTFHGTAADPGDYTALYADSDIFFDVIDDDTRRTCIEVEIIDDDVLEGMEFFSIEAVPDPFVSDFPANVQLNPKVTFIEIRDNDFSSCMAEETVVVLQEDKRIVNSLYWPEAHIGQTVSVNCTCGNIPIACASRFCGGDIATGATWETPNHSACSFTTTVGDICQLVTADMIESFLTVVDNLLAVDLSELQESQQKFNTSARLLEVTQTVTDALSIPDNESHAVIVLTFFAVAIQKVQVDNLEPQTFSALFGRTLDGATTNKELYFDVHQSSTASITVPASALSVETLSANEQTNTSIRITNSVYVNDLLFLRREEESQKVGSIIISASVSSNTRPENLDPPVRLTFMKNTNVENGTNTTCSFWDPMADNGFGDWSTRGCAVVNETEEGVVCECDHLTNFAILLDVSPMANGTSASTISKTLEALSYIGAIVSICFLTLTITTYLSSKKLRSSEPSQLLVNLCFGFLGIYIVYIFALHATALSGLCVLAGVLVHYFLLATFFIMAADAILIFNKLIFVFVKIRRYVVTASIISWSVPAIIAIATVAPDYKNYLEINFCRPYGIQFYVGLLAPFLAIYIFNWIVYIIIMVFLINHYFCKPKDTVKKLPQGSQIRQQFRNAIALSLLFGLGWAFGLPATEGIDSVSVRTAFQALFIIVTAFQGFYIFIMQCLTGSNAVDAKKEWQRWFYFITCRPTHVHAYTLSHTPASGSNRKQKLSEKIETLTLTSSKPLPSISEGKLDHATVLEMDTEKGGQDKSPCQQSTSKSISKTEESEQSPKIPINIPAEECNQTVGSSRMVFKDN